MDVAGHEAAGQEKAEQGGEDTEMHDVPAQPLPVSTDHALSTGVPEATAEETRKEAVQEAPAKVEAGAAADYEQETKDLQERGREDAVAADISSKTSVAKTLSRPMSRAGSIAQQQTNGPHQQTGAAVRTYLQEQVNDWLLQGMRWIAYVRPSEGLLLLGQYLQSAHRWSQRPENERKDKGDFHKHWLAFQAWKEADGNGEKSEDDFRASLQ